MSILAVRCCMHKIGLDDTIRHADARSILSHLTIYVHYKTHGRQCQHLLVQDCTAFYRPPITNALSSASSSSPSLGTWLLSSGLLGRSSFGATSAHRNDGSKSYARVMWCVHLTAVTASQAPWEAYRQCLLTTTFPRFFLLLGFLLMLLPP